MSVTKSLSWMALAQISNFVLQFAASVVLARYLTPYETGIYGLALATAGVLSLIQSLGLTALIVREEVLTPEIATTAFTINALIAVCLSLAIAVTSLSAGAWLGEPGVQKVLLTLAVLPIIGIFTFLPQANLQRNGRFKAIAVMGTISGIVTTVVTIGLAVNGFSYMSVAFAQWGGAAVSLVLVNVVGRRYISYRLGFASWRRVGDFGLQMLAVTGVTALSSRLSEVLLGRLLGLEALGLYNRGASLNGLIWNNIHLVAGRVILVDFADYHRRGISLRSRYLSTVEIVTALLWPAFAGLAVLAKPFIFYVYGARWVPSAGPLVLLAFASMIQVAITMTWELFAATGNLRAQTRIEFIRAFLAFVAFALACLVSIEAAAAARVFDAVVAVLLYRPHLNRMTDTRGVDFIAIYARSALLTGLAVGPAVVLMLSYGMAADTPLDGVAAAVVAGLILWVLGLAGLSHPIAKQFAETVMPRVAAFRQRSR